MEELKYFFSYVRMDSEFVLKLAKELRAVGANVWLDQLDILGGQHWDRTVEKALKNCKGMIAVLSPESVASDNVMDEVSYALDEGKLVVPVLIRSCNIPLRLRRVQYIDFTADYDTGFSQLLRALGIEQPVQPLESTAAQEPVVLGPSLPKQSESTIGEQKPAEVHSKIQKTKVFAAIFIVALITIILIGVFYLRPKRYSLNTPPAVGGSVTKSPDRKRYKHGDKVTLEAKPNDGYSFTNWSGDLSDSNNPTTLAMFADKSVTASFVLNVVTNSIDMKLVYIRDGSFMMGSSSSPEELLDEYKKKLLKKHQTEEHFRDVFPQRKVRISKGFRMGQTEVTQGQYKSVMTQPWPWSGKDNVEEDDNNSAVYVTWDKADEFCTKLSQQEGKTYRLPTEAEWEYACRAGTTTRFSFGDSDSSLGDYAWYIRNAEEKNEKYAHSVGQKKPNLWDLYDMHGNVWEWCSDFYDPNYYRDNYSKSPLVDPNGPSYGDGRSLRGGSWRNAEDAMRCSGRFWGSQYGDGTNDVGFRVVRSQ